MANLPSLQIQQIRIPHVSQYHDKNMANVEEAIKDALKRTIKIEESIAPMGLVMHNKKPAIDAVTEMGRKLEELENSVMKVAREISDHFQWKKIVDRVEQESEDLNKKIMMFIDALRSMPCLAFNAKEVEEQQRDHLDLRQKIEVCFKIKIFNRIILYNFKRMTFINIQFLRTI